MVINICLQYMASSAEPKSSLIFMSFYHYKGSVDLTVQLGVGIFIESKKEGR